jgi:1,4-alpha-glucan branching enzyme
MIRCALEKGTNQVRATFVVPDGDLYGCLVAVVGEFNDWDPYASPMRKEGDHREVTVAVQSGRRYAFRYRCDDGTWFNDDAADAYEPSGFGAGNSVLDLTEAGAASSRMSKLGRDG